MSDDPIVLALALGSSLASQAPALAVPVRMHSSSEFAHKRTVVVGDPQAPFEKLLRILSLHGLLTEAGSLRDDHRLVCVGDYFDWGPKKDRAQASFDGVRTLAWLSSHPPDQVVILAGNHDLARVGELFGIDDERFADAQVEADSGYWQKQPARPEREFCEAYEVPSWELIARDFSAYREIQRDWVSTLLRGGRMQLAYASHGVLCTHAGIGRFELEQLSLQNWTTADGPEPIADAINARVLRALRQWREGPLRIAGLHEPGITSVEGTGMLYHRFTTLPVQPPKPESHSALNRKVSVSELPIGLRQCIGHVRDKKSRTLLGLDPTEASNGVLRILQSNRERLVYRAAAHEDQTLSELTRDEAVRCATVFHVDGAMLDSNEERYQLFELDTQTILQKTSGDEHTR